mmetsp:Transcript_10380/g.21861  ORF Transcript_10380/g.21861 Transcript_10380/m.21861 type:complete len:338 (+) Transcript_10380:56-1069(+)
MGLFGKKSVKTSAVSSREISGRQESRGSLKRSLSRNDSVGSESLQHYHAKLKEVQEQSEKLASENANKVAMQQNLPRMVQESKALDGELEKLGKEYQAVIDEAKELELKRRNIKNSIHSDANAGSIQQFKVSNEKLERDQNRLQEEFDQLARTARLNTEIIDALKYQIQKQGLIVPVAEIREAEQPYEHVELALPEFAPDELFEEVPEYVVQREAEKKELEERKAASALRAAAAAESSAATRASAPYAFGSTNGAALEKTPSRGDSDRTGSGVRDVASRFGESPSGTLSYLKSNSSDRAIARKSSGPVDSSPAWVSGATKKASKWEVKTVGLSRPVC